MITNPNLVAAENGWTYAVRSEMYTQECCTCGILFAVPNDFDRRRREDHQRFYCPLGHGQAYDKSDAEKERDRLKRDLEWAENRATSWRDQAKAAEARRRGQKAANTKLKKRIAAGVCPCCKRTFQNVQQHMSNQHPNYTTED